MLANRLEREEEEVGEEEAERTRLTVELMRRTMAFALGKVRGC